MDGFVGEIRAFPFGFAPYGWLLCDGRTFEVKNNTDLYSVIRNLYGGGSTTFRLPNLRNKVLVGAGISPTGSTYKAGDEGGVKDVELTSAGIPRHTHTFYGSATRDDPAARGKNVPTPGDCYLSNVYEVPPPTEKRAGLFYTDSSPDTVLNPSMVDVAGSVNPYHNNMQPYLVIEYYICVQGTYPLRSTEAAQDL